jgi:hypothetical protein
VVDFNKPGSRHWTFGWFAGTRLSLNICCGCRGVHGKNSHGCGDGGCVDGYCSYGGCGVALAIIGGAMAFRTAPTMK